MSNQSDDSVQIIISWVPSTKSQKNGATLEKYNYKTLRKNVFENPSMLWEIGRSILTNNKKNSNINWIFEIIDGQVFCGQDPSNDWINWRRKNIQEIKITASEYESD